jgi:PAS domain-containing protein
MADTELSQDIHAHFHLFWDNFPVPVMLVRKDRTILDRNRAAEAVGCVPGTRCIDRGPKDAHKGCLANSALHEQITKRKVQYVDFMGIVMDSYWIPLSGEEDVFVHFGIDITEYAADRFFKEKLITTA